MTARESIIRTCNKGIGPTLIAAGLLALPVPSPATETIEGDLIVQGSACVGSECTNETFPFDTLRIHGPEPRLSIIDDSADGTPANDWSLGITDNGTTGASHLFIRDETTGNRVLRLDVNGAVALGSGAALVTNAVSVGAMGNERRVTHVADAEEPTDAVNLRQFEAFKDEALASVDGDATDLDQRLDDMRDRIDDLAARVDDLAAQVQ